MRASLPVPLILISSVKRIEFTVYYQTMAISGANSSASIAQTHESFAWIAQILPLSTQIGFSQAR
jgi:hypothetical protein